MFFAFDQFIHADVGEGIGGVTVTVSNASYYAVSANSGGFTIPVTTNGNYTVVFSGPGLTTTQRVATVSSLRNVKIDFVPVYSPPMISGPSQPGVNSSNLYSFTAVGAATNYQWEATTVAPYSAIEGAENGLTNVTVVSSAGYSVLASDVKASGNYSFHFCHPTSPTSQYMTLNAVVRPGTNSQLAFAKRLGWATSAQVARAQVSTNGGATWQDVWSQAGSGTSGEASFTRVTNSLSAFGGLAVQIRFVYEFVSGSYYNQTSSGVGLYLDDIGVSNAEQTLMPVTNNVPSGTSLGKCMRSTLATPGRRI